MRGFCPILSSCPFFNDTMADMPASAGILKAAYCQDDYTQCARFRLCEALGRPSVPANLYPSEGERANRILSPRKDTGTKES